ncbi:DNA-binding protein [Alkalihalophilus pseudofirmus]|uniref:XRE family transcriptional regulator n=1 Tax=Alkalihalophilus pseudofirmus TaxID=79885 RepID=A0AAJ2NNN1_ALKPS|nr:XRE family transcriptional regulator [Alkalihalophilus pseudofirmus]MDV2885696.1 XRE family transcriptional regulator [Alkalihalophilus pseudofirmus]OLS39541.1 DNA-binding protein [Alkalihalophilus pseudofirmus]WEG15999.1 XRE family transcriptional regulator [Alkalihalophilus pseudofirmus]
MEKEQLSKLIGVRLKALRVEQGYSLDHLAQITTVSKPMLGQIERGESNPTVGTLWKIAKGLNVSFTSFLEEEQDAVTVVKKEEIEPLTGHDEAFKVYPLFPKPLHKPFELFSFSLAKDSSYVSEPHQKGVEEYLVVEEGNLELTVGNQLYQLKKGQAIHFRADDIHAYKNTDVEDECIVTMLIYYPPK